MRPDCQVLLAWGKLQQVSRARISKSVSVYVLTADCNDLHCFKLKRHRCPLRAEKLKALSLLLGDVKTEVHPIKRH